MGRMETVGLRGMEVGKELYSVGGGGEEGMLWSEREGGEVDKEGGEGGEGCG